jgi:hypothetical protein
VPQDGRQEINGNRHDPGAAGNIAELKVDQPHPFARDTLERLFAGGLRA